jgi:FecR protein
MDDRQLEAWKTQEPPADFADRVLEAAARPAPVRRTRTTRVLAGLMLAAAMAVVVAFGAHRRRADAHGVATAEARQETRVGGRAVAVLEKGARIAWDGDDVRQDQGDVFWRVEPGARFVVRTPAGEVTVKGTCFRVRVLAAGAAGAVALAVMVYEGKVGVSHAGTQVDLVAGESAEADRAGVHRTGARPEPSVAAPESDHALATLDRAKADRMRAQLHALFAEAGARPAPQAPAPAPPPPPTAFPSMPMIPDPDGGTKVDPEYLIGVVHHDFIPLGRSCYTAALEKNPKLRGRVALKFDIVGDAKIGGVVDDMKLDESTTIDDREMLTCLQESMMSVSFDAPPQDGTLSIIYPFEFNTDDDEADGGH